MDIFFLDLKKNKKKKFQTRSTEKNGKSRQECTYAILERKNEYFKNLSGIVESSLAECAHTYMRKQKDRQTDTHTDKHTRKHEYMYTQ